jgi:hypothetical protein
MEMYTNAFIYGNDVTRAFSINKVYALGNLIAENGRKNNTPALAWWGSRGAIVSPKHPGHTPLVFS